VRGMTGERGYGRVEREGRIMIKWGRVMMTTI
jgi:hypothetical protein